MKIVKKIMKYFIWITIDIIWLFGLNMILPADDSNTKLLIIQSKTM